MEAITVSKLNTYIKQIFESETLLHNISVVGEVFGVSVSRNVIYFSLKDESASLSCVCFYPNFINQIIEGNKIIIVGTPKYYVKGGKLNFNVYNIEKVGQGELFEKFLKLKETLQNEGLFDEKHKKEIPKKINRIGVITSKDGAVIQDIKNIAWRRNPTVDIVLYNTKVQGNGAENEIAHAIDMFSEYPNIDVVVVARGGGSLEDLWAYNTEIVARSTYNCKKPIISAVGHETDFTIIDFVSDMRAPTPSAAAELLTFNMEDRKAEINGISQVFEISINKFLQVNQNQLQNLSLKLTSLYENFILSKEKNFVFIKHKILTSFDNIINTKQYDLGLIETTLDKIDPNKILNMGFTKIEQNSKPIINKNMLEKNKEFEIIFKDGKIIAKQIKGE